MNPRLAPHQIARVAAPLITLATAIVAGSFFGVQLVVLTLAGGALLLVIWLLWSSVQALAGESKLSFEEAFSMGARSAEEEQKRAVLRALKDLEYERSVGKISEEDFHEYSARYRAEAKRLMQSLDENLSQARKQVEQELERRLAKGREKRADPPQIEADTAEEIADSERSLVAVKTLDRESVPPATLSCPACRTNNELDARFCKACGRSMIEAEEAKS